MTQTNESGKSIEPLAQKVVLYSIALVVALVAGYYLAVALIPTPKIGIIYLDTQVGGPTVEAMS
ncbi:MAG TPA: hypothetical protein VEC93_10215, partial [Anaerolineae bacterium]|nr:hypothetical protein [Anaerolineae bacterium]